MAQPEYVPTTNRDRQRASERLPTPHSWHADRPAEVVQKGGQPAGKRFGTPGPDQGFALKLVRSWEDKLVLAPGEDREDVIAGAVAVAMRRSGQFGRAPVTFDIEHALALWGFLTTAGTDLTSYRRTLFEGCAHEYQRQRDIADHVPEHTLRMPPAEVRLGVGAGRWRQLLGAPASV